MQVTLKRPHQALDGKTLVYREDPIYFRRGWCIAGDMVSEMQTMDWVTKLVPMTGKIGQRGKVVGDQFIIEEDAGARDEKEAKSKA